MKINVANPATGRQKLIQVDNEAQLRVFFDKRMATDVPADSLGAEWKGYVVRITGGCDKEGFPMKQGVLTSGRVKLLLHEGSKCYHPLRKGERKRKSVRGCIVDQNLSVLNLVIVKKGEKDLPDLTDKSLPRRLGPKRASKIRKLFNLSKQDDVRKYVVRRALPAKKRVRDGAELKPKTRAPKIQRLITPLTLQRRRHRLALKRRRAARHADEKAEYMKLLAERTREAREKKLERKRSRSSRLSASRTSASAGDEASASGAAAGAKATKSKEAKAPAVVKQVKKAEEKKAAAAAKAPAAKAPAPAEKKADKKPAAAAAPAAAKPAAAAAAKPAEKKPAEKKAEPPAKKAAGGDAAPAAKPAGGKK